MLGVTIAALGVLAERPAAMGVRLGFALKFGAVNLAAWELGRSRSVRGQGRLLALGYVVTMAVLNAACLLRVPRDVLVGPASSVALMMATALLLPWGALPQAITCAAVAVAYGWLLGHLPGPANFSAIGLVLTTIPVSVVGARLVDHYRAASFERAWQQRQLLGLARDLAAHVEPQEVIAKVLQHGLRLVSADTVTFSLRDADRSLYRVEAVGGPGASEGSWIVGLEIPDDFPLVRQIVERRVVAIPEDDPANPVGSLLEEHGIRRVLYLAMQCGGEVVGILGFARKRDVSFEAGERQLARGLADQAALALRTAHLVADLRRANRLKSEFVATMSHELRTPLTVILGFAEMARDRSVGTDERDECLARIETAGRDLLGLIETTLEIGKMEAGRDEVQLEAVPLPAFWSDMGDACGRLPHGDAVTLVWSADVPAIALTTDPRKLTVVVRNLVGNALKFTAQGWVRVEVRLDGEHLVVRVADTGIGIRREDHATVFEMFRQADGSASRRYEGTGLGLYIVQRFVQQLGGTVVLDSDLGRGSVFTVTLPCETAAPPLEKAA